MIYRAITKLISSCSSTVLRLNLIRMESQYIWTPPTFDISRQPTLAHEAHLPSDPHFQENFARSAKWCAFRTYLRLVNPSHKGARTVRSLLHTVRTAVCNISISEFCPTNSQTDVRNLRTDGPSPQDFLNVTLPQSGPLNIVYSERYYVSYYFCPQLSPHLTLLRRVYFREQHPFLISFGIHAPRLATRRLSALSHLSASHLSNCLTPQMGG